MKKLTLKHKIFLTIIENFSVFLTVFLNQMIITVFPAYDSVKLNNTMKTILNSTSNSNCTMSDSSNVYVAILIGCKYCTELIMLPIVGMIADSHHTPLIIFAGLLVETTACILYSSTSNFYVTIVARIIDGVGYSLVSTSGLTLVYILYIKDRPRNRLITIDSILVYIASCVSPVAAGHMYESLVTNSETIARISTFALVGPMFLILAILIVPFAFDSSALFAKWLYSEEDMEKDGCQTEMLMNVAHVISNGADVKKDLEHHCDPDEYKVELKSPTPLKALLKDKHIILVLLMLIFITLTGNSLESTLPIFMIRKFCSNQWEQGIVWLFGVKSLFGFGLATFLFHIKPSICWILPLIGIICDGALCVSLPFCPTWWTIGLVLGTMCFMSSMAEVILIPIVPTIIDKKYPNTGYGSGSGLTMLTFTISGILGTFPVGPLVDRFGFTTLCIILSTLNISLAPFVLCLRQYFE